jgi:hypothetical protein
MILLLFMPAGNLILLFVIPARNLLLCLSFPKGICFFVCHSRRESAFASAATAQISTNPPFSQILSHRMPSSLHCRLAAAGDLLQERNWIAKWQMVLLE